MHFRILNMIATSCFLTALRVHQIRFRTDYRGRGGRRRGRGVTGNGEWKGRGRDARERGGEGRERAVGEEGGEKVRTPPLSIPAYAPASVGVFCCI